MFYLEVYLLIGALFTFIMYEEAQEFLRGIIKEYPESGDLSQDSVDDIIKYSPLLLIIVWPINLLNGLTK